MIDNILPLMKFCSWVLVISFINGVRYFSLKRKLKLIYYEEYKEEIHKAIRCNKIKFSTLFIEPLETGNDMLDLLLFKTHRSIMWCVGLLFFYPACVAFLYVALMITRPSN